MSINPADETLTDEQIDAFTGGILNAILEAAIEQIGSPLQLVAGCVDEFSEENILAITKRLKAIKSKWKEEAEAVAVEIAKR